jgi:hypothetical protein
MRDSDTQDLEVTDGIDLEDSDSDDGEVMERTLPISHWRMVKVSRLLLWSLLK